MNRLLEDIRACRLCADRFAATATRHAPRPVLQVSPDARLLVVGQAPGARVHESGRPFTDASGDRLRDWMGIDSATFYDASRVAVVPMAFCFPGYDARGADLPPPKLCAETWRAQLMAALPRMELVLVIGGPAQKWHLKTRKGVTETVADWRDHLPGAIPLPHPSWRNTGWIKRNPWFEAEVIPALRTRVAEALA